MPKLSFEDLPEQIPSPYYEQYLGVAKGFAAKQRLKGGGPPFIKVGRLVRYPKHELKAWLEAQQRRSTSEGC